MKVLLFSTQWPEYMIGLANAISNHCKTILMLPTNYGSVIALEDLISEKVIFEPFEVIFYKSVRRNARMIFHILKIVWKYKPDILHIQSNGHRLFFWIFFIKPWRTKIVNTIHDPVKHIGDESSLAIDDTWVKFWSRFYTKKFIVHGEYLKDLLSKTYAINKSKISVIPHGHFEIYKRIQRFRVEEDRNTILFFGRIWKYKGLDILIQASNILIKKNPQLKIIVAGKGEDISKYKKEVKFKDNVIFENRRIRNEEVGEFFEKASFIVLPYIEASQSGVIAIAYAFSKPVIVTNVGSLPEVVIQNQTGIVIKPNSVDSLVKAIMFMLKNEDKRKIMGINAYRFAKEELSWEKIAILSFKIYNSLQ